MRHPFTHQQACMHKPCCVVPKRVMEAEDGVTLSKVCAWWQCVPERGSGGSSPSGKGLLLLLQLPCQGCILIQHLLLFICTAGLPEQAAKDEQTCVDLWLCCRLQLTEALSSLGQEETANGSNSQQGRAGLVQEARRSDCKHG